MTRTDLITAIDNLSAKTGLAPATITGRAVNNSRLYARLISGGDCTTDIAGKVMDYIAKQSSNREAAE
ncbi:hypothetical protein SAMN05877809_105270 [Rhodobacter sp. JA431]|uniref:hypothetical protein n=1 Tax=Rhodobacter sp. JA431 TaxID=570013 RepID=UPI000BDD4BD1|nr:hypothetical protein [Rhodobacter sp. JA431]SOC11374.1 hypothetical protein SAMN05877809_105270 [Rhodobacter sp. JA431]